MANSSCDEIFRIISKHILSVAVSHPTRVGIDGITASGKSTFASELAETLRLSGRPVIATTIDGFHNPRSMRHRKGRDSAEGYYYDAYNYAAVVEYLLAPLGPGGSLVYQTEVFNLKKDVPLEIAAQKAKSNSILIVDGSFALRNELADCWEVGIYLDVPFPIAENRASLRDAELFGSADIAREVTRKRYHGAHRIMSI